MVLTPKEIIMTSERNKGRAIELLNTLNGTQSTSEWIAIFAKILAFLLNRYINQD